MKPLESFADCEPEQYMYRYGITAESSGTSKIAMAERLLLDTDVIINLLKKHPDTVERFIELSERGTIFLLSPIAIAEIYAGAFKHEHP